MPQKPPLNTSTIDLSTLAIEIDKHSSEISHIKDNYVNNDEVISEMREQIALIKSKQDTTEVRLKTFEKQLKDLAKSIVNFRYWLGGMIVSSLGVGLNVSNMRTTSYENKTTEKINVMTNKIDNSIQVMSLKVDDTYYRLENKIDNNFKLMIRMQNKGNID